MSTVPLIHPIEHEGELHSSIVIPRPGPVAFFRYWHQRHVPGPPPFRLNLPWTVVDRLDPADHRRVIAEMTRLAKPFVWPLAIWNFCFNRGT